MPDTTGALLDRLWAAYDDTAAKRHKSLLWLGTTLAVYAIMSITRDSTAKLPFVDTNVPLSVAFALLPAFLGIFTGQFLYTSAHAFRAYEEFIERFWVVHGESLRRQGITISMIHMSFKRRDIDEMFCMFSIPVQPTPEWSATVPRGLRRLAGLRDTMIVLTTLIPIAIYAVTLFRLWYSDEYWTKFPWPWLPFSMYCLSLVLLVFAPLFLFLRVRPARRLHRAATGLGAPEADVPQPAQELPENRERQLVSRSPAMNV